MFSVSTGLISLWAYLVLLVYLYLLVMSLSVNLACTKFVRLGVKSLYPDSVYWGESEKKQNKTKNRKEEIWLSASSIK